MAGAERFRKRQHLRSRSDFARVLAARRTAGNGVLVVHVTDNGLDWSRLGISVSKRIGHAPQRNMVKRRIREAFRKSQDALPIGYDILCVARGDAAGPGVDLSKSLRSLVVRAVRRPARRAPGP